MACPAQPLAPYRQKIRRAGNPVLRVAGGSGQPNGNAVNGEISQRTVNRAGGMAWGTANHGAFLVRLQTPRCKLPLTPMPLALADFVPRWKAFPQTENAGSQSHFLDLCELLGQPPPAAADSAGENYAFEKYGGKARGGKGFADV